MKTWLMIGWILLLPAFAVWHDYGPGREHARADRAATLLAAAHEASDKGDWTAAVAAYDEAAATIPAERVDEIRRVRLASAVAKLRGPTFAKGRESLVSLVEEMEREPARDPQTLSAARSALAYARYHTAWLMRLEGRPLADWEPQIQEARQWFRVAAEQAQTRGDASAAGRLKQDLESTVRLARMDLSDLQALNLPEELKGSGSGDGEGDGDGQGKGKGKGKGKGVGEGDEGIGEGEGPPKDARGASGGPPPDTGGH